MGRERVAELVRDRVALDQREAVPQPPSRPPLEQVPGDPGRCCLMDAGER